MGPDQFPGGNQRPLQQYQPLQPVRPPTGNQFPPYTPQPPQYTAQPGPAKRKPGCLAVGLVAVAALVGFLWLLGSLGGGEARSSTSSVATPSPAITRQVTEATLDGLKMGWDHMSPESQDQTREGWRAAKGDRLIEEEFLDGLTEGFIEGWSGEGDITVSERTTREFLDWTLTTQVPARRSTTPTQAPTTKAPTQAPTKAAKSAVPEEYRAALKQAQRYSDVMHMSKGGLYDQLTSEYGGQFEKDAAQYAVENVKADWNKNALESARRYREILSMSK